MVNVRKPGYLIVLCCKSQCSRLEDYSNVPSKREQNQTYLSFAEREEGQRS